MSAEPLSTSSAFIVTGAVGSLLGPVYGPVILMLFAATIGALLALGNTKIDGQWESARFLAVAIGLSMVLTGFGVWVVEHFTPLPGSLALMPVAFAFAAARNMIIDFIGKLLDALVGIVSRKGGA